MAVGRWLDQNFVSAKPQGAFQRRVLGHPKALISHDFAED
jgi:hypothetical protein